MISLRKRALLEANLRENSKRFKKNESTTIDNVPNEILFNIFEYLQPRDLINIRALNHKFKNFIDKCYFAWNDIKLKIAVNKKNRHLLSDFIQLIETNRFIKSSEISCDKVGAFQQCKKLSKRSNFKLTLTKLSIQSIDIINIFSNCVDSLIINSFCNDSSQFCLFNQLNSVRFDDDLSLPYLKKLKISCLTFDLKQKSYYLSSDLDYLKSLVINSNMNLKNLKDFYVKYFNGTLSSLLLTLNRLNLNRLQLEYCDSEHIRYDAYQNKSLKFKSKIVVLKNCSFALSSEILLNTLNLKKLEKLILKVKDVPSESEAENEEKYENLMRMLHKRLDNLCYFETNLNTNILVTLKNFHLFTKNITCLNLLSNINLNNLSSFIKSFLISSGLNEWLKILRLKIILDCDDMGHRNQLLPTFQLFDNYFKIIHSIYFNIECTSCKLDSTKHKQCLSKLEQILFSNIKFKNFVLIDLIEDFNEKLFNNKLENLCGSYMFF
jgi:hypothetical protein